MVVTLVPLVVIQALLAATVDSAMAPMVTTVLAMAPMATTDLDLLYPPSQYTVMILTFLTDMAAVPMVVMVMLDMVMVPMVVTATATSSPGDLSIIVSRN